MAIVNAEVKRNTNENPLGVIRRFTKRVQGTGILRKVRSIRYASRPLSSYVKKKGKLKRIQKREDIERLTKLGKFKPRSRRR